jgi:hypothetical protein
MEDMIIALLAERGPLTGAEVRAFLGEDGFGQWEACMRSERIEVRRVGRRYLRLDEKVEGYARLSPSILREFLTYSVVGLRDDPAALEAKTGQLAARIKEISAGKLRLAQRLIDEMGAHVLEADNGPEERFCVLLAGDIVYEMAHDAPRPERSTGRMVRGSDLDLVVIMHDGAPPGLAEELDQAIYQCKHRHLTHPTYREEIDYVIKPFSRMVEQAAFDGFKSMVSCKILDEAVLLYGSSELYDAAKALLVERGIAPRLAEMEEAAIRRREQAEQHLLSSHVDGLADAELYLFYTSEESEEFE